MMRKFMICILASLLVGALPMKAKENKGEPSKVSYVLHGDYPDPTIIKDGKWYYMTHSSFDYVPGLTILKSQDLKHWIPVNYALNHFVGSVWAPDICKYKGKYYIYFTVAINNGNFKNYVVWTDDIEHGKWSQPIDVHVDGKIDPGHLVDAKTGQRWLFVAGGYRVRLTDDGLASVGELEHVYGGWKIPSDWEVESTSLEGPKMAHHGDYYYYVSAQGGTAGPPTSHMAVVARSKSIDGPWENMPTNPLVHTWSAQEQWHSKGHATLFEGNKKQWYLAFHAYEKYYQNMGRNTIIEPVEFTSNQWLVAPMDTVLEHHTEDAVVERNLGDFHIGLDWRAYQDYDASRFFLSKDESGNASLVIKGKGDSPATASPLLFIAHAHRYEFSAKIERSGEATAGLVLYYNKSNYAGTGFDANKRYRYRRAQRNRSGACRGTQPLWLKVRVVDTIVSTFISYDGKRWSKDVSSMDISGYNHNTLGDFMSVLPGIFVSGEGEAKFSEFKYELL